MARSRPSSVFICWKSPAAVTDQVELETRLAYQDETLRQLSAEVARQQQDIERLNRRLTALAGQIESLRDEPGAGTAEPPPPHY